MNLTDRAIRLKRHTSSTIYGKSMYTITAQPDGPGLVKNGWLFFADVNWWLTEYNEQNIFATQKIFDQFFGGVKDIACPTYIGELAISGMAEALFNGIGVLTAPYYEGAPRTRSSYLPVMHAALDPLGYTFTNYDITIAGAGNDINKPFLMPLYGPGVQAFNQTVIDNLRQIASKKPVIVIGEWNSWAGYDNYILDNVMYYPEITYGGNNEGGNGIPNINHPLGLSLSAAGVTLFDYNATGVFSGGNQYGFAVTTNTNQPCMLELPYRAQRPQPPSP